MALLARHGTSTRVVAVPQGSATSNTLLTAIVCEMGHARYSANKRPRVTMLGRLCHRGPDESGIGRYSGTLLGARWKIAQSAHNWIARCIGIGEW
jgi:hypothetical protein